MFFKPRLCPAVGMPVGSGGPAAAWGHRTSQAASQVAHPATARAEQTAAKAVTNEARCTPAGVGGLSSALAGKKRAVPPDSEGTEGGAGTGLGCEARRALCSRAERSRSASRSGGASGAASAVQALSPWSLRVRYYRTALLVSLWHWQGPAERVQTGMHPRVPDGEALS